jgi:Ca-activated chloride channel family protein
VTWADWRWLVVGGALVVVLALVYSLDFTRRRHLLERIGHAPQLQRMTDSVWHGARVAKAILTVFGVALLAVALAGPRLRGERIWKDRGIDLVIVMDFSKSMLARDVYPSRSERAKLAADSILDRLAGDRVSIVAFAGGAVHFPLTSDYEAARTLYHGLDPRDMPPGSDLGEAIAMGRCLLIAETQADPDCRRVRGDEGERDDAQRKLEQSDLGDRARALLVITDGEDTEGRAKAEVKRARDQGITVIVLGVGTKAGGRVPELDADGNQIGWKMAPDGQNFFMTRLDEDTLRALASSPDGEENYFRDDPRRFSMDPILKRLRSLKEGELSKRLAEDVPFEIYQILLYPAFLALLIEACLGDRRRRGARGSMRA